MTSLTISDELCISLLGINLRRCRSFLVYQWPKILHGTDHRGPRRLYFRVAYDFQCYRTQVREGNGLSKRMCVVHQPVVNAVNASLRAVLIVHCI